MKSATSPPRPPRGPVPRPPGAFAAALGQASDIMMAHPLAPQLNGFNRGERAVPRDRGLSVQLRLPAPGEPSCGSMWVARVDDESRCRQWVAWTCSTGPGG
jgi:hypothetical protein